jgi:hypothetical protein
VNTGSEYQRQGVQMKVKHIVELIAEAMGLEINGWQ